MLPIPTLVSLASKALNRDLSVEANLFFRARAAVGTALSREGQIFFMENWPKLVDFMESPQGQKEIAKLIDTWAQTLIPPTLAKPPVENPPEPPPPNP